jgi:hypothetical protein
MRLTVAGDFCNEEMVAQAVSISTDGERFAVHPAIGISPKGAYTVSHVDTGFAIAHGTTVNDAIEMARKTWEKATPGERIAAKTRAIAVLQAREILGQVNPRGRK